MMGLGYNGRILWHAPRGPLDQMVLAPMHHIGAKVVVCCSEFSFGDLQNWVTNKIYKSGSLITS
jgi:hypothetical protein